MNQLLDILKLPQRHLYATLIVSTTIALIPDSIEKRLHIPDSARGYKYVAFVIAIACVATLIVTTIGNSIESRRMAKSDRDMIKHIQHRCDRLTKQQHDVIRAFLHNPSTIKQVNRHNSVIKSLIDNEILILENGFFDFDEFPCSINPIAAEYFNSNRRL